MKRIFSVHLIALGLLVGLGFPQHSSAQQPADTLRLTLDDALRIAFTQGETLRIDSLEVAKVKESRRITIAKLYPQINATTDYSYTLQKQVMYLGGGKNMPPIPGMEDFSKGIKVGKTNNISAGITLGVPIIAPQLWSSLKLSRQQLETSVIESEFSRAALTCNVTKAYYGLQLAREMVDVMEQSHQNAQLNLKDIEQKYDAGLVPYYDKLRAEVQVKNLEPNLIQAHSAVESAQRTLCILLGIDIETPISPLGGEYQELSDEQHTDLYTVLLHADSTAAPYPELLKTDKQIEMLKTQEEIAKRAYFPTLSLVSFYRVSAMDDSFKLTDYRWTPYSAIQLTLSIPIFNGFERAATLKKARLTTRQATLQRELQRKNLDAEAKSLLEKLETALQKIKSAETAATIASTGYEIAKKRYDTGTSTLVELNDADLQLLQSRLNLKQATFEYYNVKAELDKLQGKSYALPSHSE